jgi:hypothetical protein
MENFRKLDDFECVDRGDFFAVEHEEPMFSIPLDVIGMQVAMVKRQYRVEYVGRFQSREA